MRSLSLLLSCAISMPFAPLTDAGKLIAILAAGAAAVAGGVFAATRGGGGQNTPASAATTVAPGIGTVGPPR